MLKKKKKIIFNSEIYFGENYLQRDERGLSDKDIQRLLGIISSLNLKFDL